MRTAERIQTVFRRLWKWQNVHDLFSWLHILFFYMKFSSYGRGPKILDRHPNFSHFGRQ